MIFVKYICEPADNRYAMIIKWQQVQLQQINIGLQHFSCKGIQRAAFGPWCCGGIIMKFRITDSTARVHNTRLALAADI